MITHILAHAGESHDSEIVAVAHELTWYAQLAVFAIAISIFAYLVWLITKKQDKTILVTAFALLISGFGLFKIAPVASATAITLGLISTLLVTLLGLDTSSTSDKK